jgi:putative ABC transport system permease protein
MPDWRRDVERRLPGAAPEIVLEIAQHLDEHYAELLAAGEPPESAYRRAVESQLGTVSTFSFGGGPMLGNIGQDLRYALRMVRKKAGVALVAVLTLAVGIGATTAIFTVVNAVMVRPLPFPQPDRLVRAFELAPEGSTFTASHPNFLDWKQQNRSFDSIAAYSPANFIVTSAQDAERIAGWQVSAGFFSVIGVSPAAGRSFTEEEDKPGGNTRVAVISHSFWQNRFSGERQIVGKQIVLNESTYDVVGVLPESFPWLDSRPDILVPLAADPARPRNDHRIFVIGRMKKEVTLSQAQSDMSEIARGIAARFPQSNKDWGIELQTFRDAVISPETRTAMWVFAAASAFVLLIACANVANLLLARSADRHQEISIRIAIGAGRYRIVRQLLIEALTIALLGGIAGVGLAFAGTKALRSLDAGALPRVEEISVDGQVLLFSLIVSVVTGVTFGLAPALQASRPNLNESLKEGGRGGSAALRRQRLRGAFVVIEVALSIMLLGSAGLLLRSFWTLQNVTLGFEPANILTMRLTLPSSRYAGRVEATAFYQRLLEQLDGIAGVEAVAAASNVPLGGGNTGMSIVLPEKPETRLKPLPIDWRIVSPEYFKTLRIPLRGRTFGPNDMPGGAPVVIVSDEMARRFWPGEDVIGKTFVWEGDSANSPNTIVGVAGDVQNISLDRDPRPVAYMPLAANSTWNPMLVSVRTMQDPAAITTEARKVVRGLDPNIPLFNIQTAQELVDRSLGDRRFRMLLIAAFAVIAVLLACVGLFSVMADLVSQRTHEIGVRLSLGARPADVFRLIVGRGMILALAGSLAGLGGALLVGRRLQDLLFRVRPTDPLALGSAVVVLLCVCFLACYIPARRAMKVDPLIAVRHE